MIKYTLKCDQGHSFDSWFQTAEAFDKLIGKGMVACAMCGSVEVSKSLMAPRVRPARTAAAKPEPDKPALAEPASEQEKALTRMRKHIEKNSDYVGLKFADEARAMHDGTAPARAIHGEARPDEARKLLEDGVPVAPLPFLPKRKTN